MDTELNQPSTSFTQDIIGLSKDLETEGFDSQAGETWVYPTNYTVREYQYNIIQEALLNNTMVSLPTGLGKTFIAAVVMYNFYRWYPNGKIIFMAPTRPLVKQQIDACYNIMAIPKDVTAELTGTKVQSYRKEIWKDKRVFFITPQILQNDLTIITELGNKIKCIIFDEAHKAKGNHAYCEVIRRLVPQNKYFRVLALSATPGSTLQDVLEVIHNLLISHLEVRTDESPDVTPYIFQRSLSTVVVPLDGKLQQVRSDYMQILEKYTRLLIQHRVITGNCAMLTKGKIFMTMKDYQEKSKTNRDRAYPEIMRNLNICITLYHGYELLIRHGLRGFLSFFEDHAEKPILRGNVELHAIMQDVSNHLGPAPNIEPLPDGSIAEIPESTKFGHPKFYKLRDILTDHFNQNSDNGSRVIVFCEYRESVMEAYALLLRHKPLIKPRIFLGQGAITQKQQINVIKAFKQGECNTLISTCIGEEGLDVGDVDLIVCFDINNKSPVRMVQRMGRTGRKRQGHVIVLVTEGKEQQTLKECLIHKQNLTNHILQSSALYKQMYPKNPRMIPEHINPKCHKMFITVKVESNEQKPSKRKNSSLKDMFDNISNSKKPNISTILQNYDDTETSDVRDHIPKRKEYFNKVNPLSDNVDSAEKDIIDFSRKLGKLRVLQPIGEISHSRDSQFLVSLLQFAESKKYNIPLSQVPVMPSQLSQPKNSVKLFNYNGFKQTDIRNMFGKPKLCNKGDLQIDKAEQEKEDTSYTKQILKSLQTEISTYLALRLSSYTTCDICENLFHCSQFLIVSDEEVNLKNWIEPDISIFDNINLESLSAFADSLNPESNKLHNKLEVVDKTTSEKLDGSVNKLQVSPFKSPTNLEKILKKCDIPFSWNDSIFNNIKATQLENFDEALSFFKMDSVEDIFKEDSLQINNLCSTPKNKKVLSDSQDTIIYTPGIIDSANKCIDSNLKRSCSPILNSFDKRKDLKHKVQKQLFKNQIDGSISHKPNLSKLLKIKNESKTSFYETKEAKNKKSNDDLSKSNNELKMSFCETKTIENNENDAVSDDESVPDVIDTSFENVFESIACTQITKKCTNKENKNKIETKVNSNIYKNSLQDFCDDSLLGTLFEDNPFDMTQFKKKQNTTQNQTNENTENLKKINEGQWKEDSVWDFCIDQSGSKTETEPTKERDTINNVIDLTRDSPTKSSSHSPTLIKSQNSIFSQLKSQPSSKSSHQTEQKKNVKKKASSKLQLLHSNKAASITSMDWFTNGNKKTSPQSCNKSFHTVTILDDDSPIKTNDIESDTDGSFIFTFNHKKQLPNATRNLLSLTSKIPSPKTKEKPPSTTLNNNKKDDLKENKNIETKPIKRKAAIGMILDNTDDSDNDFAIPKNINWLKKKPTSALESMHQTKRSTLLLNNVRKKIKKKSEECPYLDLEAEVTLNEITISDSDDEDIVGDNDKFEESFVDDETQNFANNTTMHAHYLKSTRSPLLNRGKFKIPNKPKNFVNNVYSQLVSQEADNTYVNDSFCVNTEEIEFENSHDMSVLEMAELMLEDQKSRKNVSKKQTNNKKKCNRKRRRILECSSSSDSSN